MDESKITQGFAREPNSSRWLLFMERCLRVPKIILRELAIVGRYLLRLPDLFRRALASSSLNIALFLEDFEQDPIRVITSPFGYLFKGLVLAVHYLRLAITSPFTYLVKGLTLVGRSLWVGVPFPYLVKGLALVVRSLWLGLSIPFNRLNGRKAGGALEDMVDILLATSGDKVREMVQAGYLSKEEATKIFRQFQEQVEQLSETCSVPPSNANGASGGTQTEDTSATKTGITDSATEEQPQATAT